MFFQSSVINQTREHDISKTSKPISMQLGSSGPRGKDVNGSTFGDQEVKGQGHTTPKIDLAEASFSTLCVE